MDPDNACVVLTTEDGQEIRIVLTEEDVCDVVMDRRAVAMQIKKSVGLASAVVLRKAEAICAGLSVTNENYAILAQEVNETLNIVCLKR